MKKIVYWILGSLTTLSVLGFVGYVHANPSFLFGPCVSDGLVSTSSLSVAYFSAGHATSTVGKTTLCNLTLNNGSVSTGLSLNITHVASSSPLSVVDAVYQWSNDGSTWYYQASATTTTVTPTNITMYSPIQIFRFQQLSTTTDILTGVQTATTTETVEINTPDRARYFRAFFYTPTGFQPSAFRAEVTPRKQSI